MQNRVYKNGLSPFNVQNALEVNAKDMTISKHNASEVPSGCFFFQTSVDPASNSVNTLYKRLLMAGPILRSVKAPFLFADFLCPKSASNIILIIYHSGHRTCRSSSTNGPCSRNAFAKLMTLGYSDAIPYAIGGVTRTTSCNIFTKVSPLSSPVFTWPDSIQNVVSRFKRCNLLYSLTSP